MTKLSTCLLDEPAFNNLSSVQGDQFILSTDGKLYYIDAEGKFDQIQNDNHATLINKDWRLKTIHSSRNLTKLTSCLSDYTNFVTSLDMSKPIYYAQFFHRYTNGFFRPMQDAKSAETYFSGPIDLNSASSFISKVPPQFSTWIKITFLPAINPARRKFSNVDDVIFKFESLDEPKVSGRHKQISPEICNLTTNTFGDGNEDFLLDVKNSKCQYLVRQFTTTLQLKQFLTKFGQEDFNDLMTSLALADDSRKTSLLKGTDDLAIYFQQWLATQPPGVKNSIINAYNVLVTSLVHADDTRKTSLLKGSDDLAIYYQQWLATQPPGVKNTIINAYCQRNPTAKECLCVMRNLDADYKKFARFNNFPDSCWFLPCKDSTEYNVPSDLLRPRCPNVCKKLTEFINNKNIKLSQNSNIINCNSAPDQLPTPQPSNNTNMYMLIGIICILAILLVIVKFL